MTYGEMDFDYPDIQKQLFIQCGSDFDTYNKCVQECKDTLLEHQLYLQKRSKLRQTYEMEIDKLDRGYRTTTQKNCQHIEKYEECILCGKSMDNRIEYNG